LFADFWSQCPPLLSRSQLYPPSASSSTSQQSYVRKTLSIRSDFSVKPHSRVFYCTGCWYCRRVAAFEFRHAAFDLDANDGTRSVTSPFWVKYLVPSKNMDNGSGYTDILVEGVPVVPRRNPHTHSGTQIDLRQRRSFTAPSDPRRGVGGVPVLPHNQ